MRAAVTKESDANVVTCDLRDAPVWIKLYRGGNAPLKRLIVWRFPYKQKKRMEGNKKKYTKKEKKKDLRSFFFLKSSFNNTSDFELQ